MTMEADTLTSIPTPLSPTRQKHIAKELKSTEGSKTTKHEVRSCSTNMQSFTYKVPPRGSGSIRSSTSSDVSDQNVNGQELCNVLNARRLKVDTAGASWESPIAQRGSGHVDSSGITKDLFGKGGTGGTSSPCDGPAPWPCSGKVLDEENATTTSPQMTDSDSESTPTTPTNVTVRRSKGSKRDRKPASQRMMEKVSANLSENQAEAVNTMTPAQREALVAILLATEKIKGSSDDSSQASSSNDSSSVDNISDGAGMSRSHSLPSLRCQYSENVPSYPDLRKKRLSGQRSVTPLRVRFAGDENGNTSSDEDYAHSAPGSVSLGTRGRRISRGPDGNTYKVRTDEDDSPEQEAKNMSISEAATVVAEGTKGAFLGGAAGALVGVGGALFTFGLSIPACALAGATYNGYNRATQAASAAEAPQKTSNHKRRNSDPARPRSDN